MKNMRKTTRTRSQAIQKIVGDNGFLKKYWEALLSISNTLRNEKPDYILALTRKAPHLLELMQLSGIWSRDVLIISEKAIDFIPPEKLKGKKIIIFDDIIISGTTIADLLLCLIKKYDGAEFKVVCVAIDEETIAARKDDGHYVFEINGKKFPIDCKVSLTMDERFIFCNEIVRSFVFLNKSYDVDYCMFYTHMGDGLLSFLSTQTSPDKAYNLTTVFQHNSGYKRYTFLPSHEYSANRLFKSFFQTLNVKSQICKVRAYHNEKTNHLTLVPMVTFELPKDSIQKIDIFTDHLSSYNELIEHAKELIDIKTAPEAFYRFLWYIISYLYGVSFYLRNSTEDRKLLSSHFLLDALNPNDISLLFGPFLSEVITKFLAAHTTETIHALEEIHRKRSDSLTSSEYQTYATQNEKTPILDKCREEIYEKIKGYIVQHISVDDVLTKQLATIFEGLYYEIEIREEEKYRREGLPQNGSKRLGVGFNYAQLKWILSTHGIPLDSDDSGIRMSLALDFLVDAGIQIPIFYEREDKCYERAYRYGEDGLSALQYGFLIDSVAKDLFDYMKQTDNREIFPQIPFEKIGVILRKDVYDSGVVDVLCHKVPDANDRNLDFALGYLRHGTVLRVIDEADESLGNPPIFTEWCKREGIITETPRGVSYCKQFLTAHAFHTKRVPILFSREKVARFQIIARLLYHIDRKIDPETQSDYLIALVTCDGPKNYFEAIREEIRLFFRSNEYRFSFSLDNMLNYLQNKDGTEITNASKVAGRTKSAAHGTKHKKGLWDKVHVLAKNIDEHFMKSELRLQYEHLLYPLLSSIVTRRRSIENEVPIKDFKEKLDEFGELCANLSDIMYSLVQLCVEPLVENQKDKAIKLTNELTETITSWNRCIEENAKVNFSGKLVGELPKISCEMDSIFSKYNEQERVNLMQHLFPQIKACYETLNVIFENNYTRQPWEENMKRLGLAEPDEVVETPYKFVVQYDLKDSSGKKYPENKRKSPILKKYINSELQKTKKTIGDGRFNLKEDDGKNIYIEKPENVKKYLSTLMKTTAEYQMFLRIGIISTQDTTGEPFYVRKKDNEIDITPQNTAHHTLVNRLATYPEKEKEKYHRLTISNDVMNKVWGNENNFNLLGGWHLEWEYSDQKSKKHVVSFQEVNKILDIYIVKCYSGNEMKNKKQLTLTDYYEP